MDKFKEKLAAAWSWTKANWKWLLFPIGLLLYVVGRAAARRDVTVVSPGLVEHQEVQAELDAKAAKQKQEADAKAVGQLSSIEAGRSARVGSETQKQVAEVEAAQGDPTRVNDLLKKVGKDIRDGK